MAQVIGDHIIQDINASKCYSTIAQEAADFSYNE